MYWYFSELSSELEYMEYYLHSSICPHDVMLWHKDNVTFNCTNYNLHHINRHQEQSQLKYKVYTYKDFILYIWHVFEKNNFIRIRNRLSTHYNFITATVSFSASLLLHSLLYLYTTLSVELSFLLIVKLFCADYCFHSGCRYTTLLHCVACTCRICLGGYVYALLVQNHSSHPVLHYIFHSVESVITSYPVLWWILLVSSTCCDSFLLLNLCCILLFGM
jgi:hypothetical protein